MTKYNTKTFNGIYTILVIDKFGADTYITKLPQKVDLVLKFEDGIMDAISNTNLVRMIKIIQRDIDYLHKTISIDILDDKGEVQYINMQSNYGGREELVDAKKYSLTSIKELEGFVTVLNSMSMQQICDSPTGLYTPLLSAKTQSSVVLDDTFAKIHERGVITRIRKLFGRCFGI